jgi:hypothetical protein
MPGLVAVEENIPWQPMKDSKTLRQLQQPAFPSRRKVRTAFDDERKDTMSIDWKIIRCIAALSLILIAGSATATWVAAQDPTATGAVDVSTTVPTAAPVVEEEDDSFDDWGLFGLLGLLGLAGLLRKPKTEVQTVTRTVTEPPVTRTVVEPPITRPVADQPVDRNRP